MKATVTTCDRCGIRIAAKFVDDDGDCIGCRHRDGQVVTDGGEDCCPDCGKPVGDVTLPHHFSKYCPGPNVDIDKVLLTDGGRDVDEDRFDVDGGRRAEAAERQADALECIADEMEYQNAVLTEVAHALWYVAVSANEYSDPDERAERVPSHRGLRTNIDDQQFTREEDDR